MFRESVSRAQETITGKPSNLATGLIETIDYIAKARDSELQFDKTIVAEVVHCTNTMTEEYEYYVRYQQGLFKAYWSGDKSKIFDPGTNVYVKIPNGDFSTKKIIEGTTDINATLNEFYNYETQNIREIYKLYENKEEYSLTLKKQNENDQFIKNEIQIYNDEDASTNNQTIENLSLSYPNLKIKADFKTDFNIDSVRSGNYGLKVVFYCKDLHSSDVEQIQETEMILDISSFSGSIYDYHNYSSQYALFKTTDKTITKIKSISLFAERFNSELENNHPNIYIKNIEISLNEIDEEKDNLYKIWVSSPEGLELINDSDSLILQGHFTYSNKDMLSSSTCQCYWFKMNPTIIAGDERYSPYGGKGWELIENNNFNILTLKSDNIYQEEKIKFVLIYNNSLKFEYELPKSIKKKYNNRFALSKTVEEEKTYLELLDGRPTDKIEVESISWHVISDDGVLKQISTSDKEYKILINNYLSNNNSVSFYAYINLSEDKNCVLDFTIASPVADDSINVIITGQDNFLYDQYGNIANELTAVEATIKASVAVGRNVYIKNSYWELYDLNNESESIKLSSQPTSSSTSMLTQVRVDESNPYLVYFKIAKSFSKAKKNNTLKLTIETIDNKIYYFSKDIVFSKEGWQGATGLKYNLVIDQCNYNGKEINNSTNVYSIIYYNEDSQNQNNIYLKPSIYYEGEKIYNEQQFYYEGMLAQYSVKYITKGINLNISQVNSSNEPFFRISTKKTVLTPEDIETTLGQYFAYFEVDIKIKTAYGNEEIKDVCHANYFYPILIGNNLESNKLKIKNGLNEIVYNVNGQDPLIKERYVDIEYLNKEVSKVNSLTNQTISTYQHQDINNTDWGLVPIENYTGAILKETDEAGGIKNYSFDEKGTMGALQFIIDENNKQFLIYPIPMLLSSQLSYDLFDGTTIPVIYSDSGEDSTITTPSSASGYKGVAAYLGMKQMYTSQEGTSSTYTRRTVAEEDQLVLERIPGFYTTAQDENGINKITNSITPKDINFIENYFYAEDKDGIRSINVQDGIFKVQGMDNFSLLSIGQEEDLSFSFGREEDEDPENPLHIKEFGIRDLITVNYSRENISENPNEVLIGNVINNIEFGSEFQNAIIKIIEDKFKEAEKQSF